MKALQVFWQFFLLGWTSFGGPAAHLGYFHRRFVVELKWLNESDYGQLVALSQFLPGPGSSQVGFGIGRHHAGILGAWAAFVGFTLPSFALLLWVALYQPNAEQPWFAQMIIGLKLLAVVVIADATLKMFISFCTEKWLQSLAILSAITLLLLPSAWSQIVILLLAFGIGLFWHRTDFNKQNTLLESELTIKASNPAQSAKPRMSWWSSIGLVLLTCLWMLALAQPELLNETLMLFAHFAQAGSLVFGGGHVVLPLLQNSLDGQIPTELLLSGYALAQAVPGPMFSVASFYGAYLLPEQPVFGALLASLGIFLPGLLLMLALQSNWQLWAQKSTIQGAMAGINAAVVGLLLATLFSPVFLSAVVDKTHFVWVLIGFALLRLANLKIGWLVAIFALIYPLSTMLVSAV